MNTNDKSFERCLSFINCQLTPSQERGFEGKTPRMAVTLSRQTGSGAMRVAQKLADYLQAKAPCECPWTVFDRNLIERVLEDHHLPTRIAKFLPEDSISGISDAVEELLGLHPPSWEVVHHTTETILRLVELGNVILIGRGATVITSKLPNVVHVRLVASLETRIERIQQQNDVSRPKAVELIRRSDQGRARYWRKYFHQDINDPLLYDMILNTDRFSTEGAARLIGDVVLERAAHCKPVTA